MTITLATLSQATAQEVFDQVATHLLKQKPVQHLRMDVPIEVQMVLSVQLAV